MITLLERLPTLTEKPNPYSPSRGRRTPSCRRTRRKLWLRRCGATSIRSVISCSRASRMAFGRPTTFSAASMRNSPSMRSRSSGPDSRSKSPLPHALLKGGEGESEKGGGAGEGGEGGASIDEGARERSQQQRRRQHRRAGADHRRGPGQDGPCCDGTDEERERRNRTGAEQDGAAHPGAQRRATVLRGEMAARDKRSQAGAQHQRDEQYNRRHAVA